MPSALSKLIKTPGITLFVGKTESGKSHMLKYVIKVLCSEGHFYWGVVISPTGKWNGDYTYMPKDFIIDPNKQDVNGYLRKLMYKLSKLVEQGIDYPGFIIVDDSIGSIDWNSKLWTEIVSTVRHYRASLFITTQYLHKMPTVMRSQVNQVIFTKIINGNELEAAYKNWFSFMKKKVFIEFVRRNTSNHNCIFYNNHSLTMEDYELYKIIRAPETISPFYLNF